MNENRNENIKYNNLEQIVKDNKPWTSLSLSQKMLFIDNWVILSVFTNLVQICGSTLYFLQYLSVTRIYGEEQKSLILGLGVFFSWINILKYTNYYQSVFPFTQILAKTLPGIANFFIAFLPIFFCFIIVGITSFCQFEHFESVSQTVSTLFALMTADSISMITQNIHQKGYSNMFFIFSYVFIFFIAVHSIIVAIIVHKSKKSIVTK